MPSVQRLGGVPDGPTLGQIFGAIRPTNAALVVQFPVPQVKVEIAAIAVIGCGS